MKIFLLLGFVLSCHITFAQDKQDLGQTSSEPTEEFRDCGPCKKARALINQGQRAGKEVTDREKANNRRNIKPAAAVKQ